MTPLSLTSTTSRGGQLAQPIIHGTENNYRVSGMFSQSGLILPTGTTLPSNTTHLGLTRCGPNEFPSTMFQRHCTPDVTEKFNKFDLPPNRMTESKLFLCVFKCMHYLFRNPFYRYKIKLHFSPLHKFFN